MRIDMNRFRQYLSEITRNSIDLKNIVGQGMMAPGSMELKAAKYILIELAEAMKRLSKISKAVWTILTDSRMKWKVTSDQFGNNN
jgi:hypothetical protein